MEPAETIAFNSKQTKIARQLLTTLLVGGTALVALHDWLGVGGERFDFVAGGPLYDAVVLAAAIACLVKAHETARERWAWLVIGLAIFAWACGEVYWTWFLLDRSPVPIPNPADAGYLLFYPISIVGLALLVRARANELNPRRWLDGLIAALGTAALGTAFVFDFVAAKTTGTSLEVAVTLAYPLGDIVVLGLIVGAIAVTDWRPGRVWSFLLAGLAAQVVADIAYTLQLTDGALPAGNWIDPIYLLSAVFLGLATLQRQARPHKAAEPSDVRHELAVPVVFATVMTGLFVSQYFSPASAPSTAFRALTVLAIIVRLAVSVRENRVLLERVRTDPLTGLSNRGKMHVDLAAHCASATADAPVALALFDLNGFKRYNDTFGHPAGDALLARLGPKLQEAVGDDGIAYRVGGDEFCGLLTCGEDRLDEVMRRATEALGEKGPGFEVTASWGVAVIPRDADDADDAMELADVRMYAQKESRRVANERHEPAETVKVATWPRATKGA